MFCICILRPADINHPDTHSHTLDDVASAVYANVVPCVSMCVWIMNVHWSLNAGAVHLRAEPQALSMALLGIQPAAERIHWYRSSPPAITLVLCTVDCFHCAGQSSPPAITSVSCTADCFHCAGHLHLPSDRCCARRRQARQLPITAGSALQQPMCSQQYGW